MPFLGQEPAQAALVAADIADGAVTTAKLAAAAVTDAKVATGISGTKLTDGTVTAAKLNTANIDRSLNVASGNLGINNVISVTREVLVSQQQSIYYYYINK